MRGSIVITALAACGGSEQAPNAPRVSTPLVVTGADLTQSANGPPSIPPQRLEPHRLTGDKRVTPGDDVREAAHRTGMKLVGSFKFCLDTTGHPTTVKVLQTTRAPSYDEKIMAEIRRWSFTPVWLEGKPIEVCSAVTFIYTAR